MKRIIVLSLVTSICFGGIAQQENQSVLPKKGLHFGGGLHTAVPTGDFTITTFFPPNSSITDQSLLSEWNNPKLGGYFDISYNVSQQRPFFIGYHFGRQLIFKDLIQSTSIDPNHPGIGAHYLLRKKANLTHNQFYGEIFLYGISKFHFYARASIGWSTYREQNIVRPVGGYESLESSRSTERVFAGDIGLVIRYQFSERFGLRMLAGYQFQEANNFKSKDYFSELSATVNETKTDFFNHEIVSNYEPVLEMSTRNQYLYFQVGIVHVFDRRSFLNNSDAKGDPIIW